MKFIENLNELEYSDFLRSNSKSHFMQSLPYGEVMKYKNFTPRYIGMKSNGVLVAVCLILQKKLTKKYSYFYLPRGPILDYNNFDLIKEFTICLKKYAKNNKAIFFKIDPDIKLHDLDQDGKIMGNDNYNLVDYLKDIGYKHKGLNVDFVNEQPRFTFRLDLNKSLDEIYSNIHPTTRKILNKENQYNLNIYKGNINDIEKFYETMQDTALREGLLIPSIEYYKSFYSILNKNNMSDLYIAEVNIDNLLGIYNNKLNLLKNELISLDDPKYKNKDKVENIKNDLKNQINKIIVEIENTNKISKKTVVLSSIITVKFDAKVWTIHGGNSNILRELNANYLLYYTIIKDAHENNSKFVDFFGTSGIANPDKDNPIFGIHSFKKRFGGEYNEFIGEFDYITNKKMYFIYKKLLPIYKKFK